jgi:hypothetical protein
MIIYLNTYINRLVKFKVLKYMFFLCKSVIDYILLNYEKGLFL